MKAEIEVLQDLIIKSMTLELARQANLLTRFDIEHFISKLRVWVKEEFNEDYVKMWDAFSYLASSSVFSTTTLTDFENLLEEEGFELVEDRSDTLNYGLRIFKRSHNIKEEIVTTNLVKKYGEKKWRKNKTNILNFLMD